MEGKGPYRIYDPGGSEVKAREEAGGGGSYRQLLEENGILRERMKGLKSLGDLLEESQSEALKLRQRVEELVRDNEALKSSSFAASLCMGGPVHTEAQGRPHVLDGKHCLHPAAEQKEEQASCLGKTLQPEKPGEASEFEGVNVEGKTSDALTAGSAVPILPQENIGLVSQLKRLESSFSIFAEESNPNQLLAHLGRMAVEFHHLSSKVQKNEQRTSLLQTLCEQLRQENNELRKKMDEDHHLRNHDLDQLRQENLKLKELVTGPALDTDAPEAKEEPVKEESAAVRPKMEATTPQKSGKAAEKSQSRPCDAEVYEKKIKLLEKQRKDVLEVNKQWDVQWTSMKAQFEQKALEEALNLHTPSAAQQPPGQSNFADAANNLKKQELLTQIAVLKEQVKIFEEDFRKERSDRERMNEEKEDLRRQVERLQGQITNLTNQLHQAQNECQRERTERCKLERLQMQHHKQVLAAGGA
ncbi:TNFAIP3-interacting protein 1 [Liparis tanakae]|uniref:TNFAIP3-interacting protein 1 n=1 Tax=Liparis tanakae TaxID=230148 RepID=A0A4Z2F1Z3_9TELE|nr:TNFAIP3-interacting protein 1 [Liparis tanakae]